MHSIVCSYPYSKDNSKIFKIVKSNIDTRFETGGGRRTYWDLHQKGIKEIDKLLSWLKSQFDRVSNDFILPQNRVGGIRYDFKVHSCWGVIYEKTEGVEMHNHFPYAFSFVYYVNVPQGSAPLTLVESEIKPKAGQLIIFPSILPHGVFSNESSGRCCLSGNILFIGSESSPGGG